MNDKIRTGRILLVLTLLVLFSFGIFALLFVRSHRKTAVAEPAVPPPNPTAETAPPPAKADEREAPLRPFTLTDGRHETRYLDWGYLLYAPRLSDGEEKPPLVVYLHGTKGAGYDPTLLARYDEGLGRFLDEEKVAPNALILLPQSETAWSSGRTEMAELSELIVWAVEAYGADPDRVSLVGCSAGGIACFEMLATYPELFCCGVVIGGATSPEAVADLKMPLRIYHGAKDSQMGFSVIKADALINENGGHSELFLLEDVGHDEQFVLYDDAWGLWDWVLAQKRGA